MKTPRFTIRKTTSLENITLIEEMDAKLFNDGSALIQDLDGYFHYWLVWCEGLPVGYCVAEECQGGIVINQRVGVLKPWRGHSLQKKMIKIREKYFGEGTRFITYVHPSNPASMNSLISAGYKTYRPKDMYGGEEMVYFFKEI